LENVEVLEHLTDWVKVLSERIAIKQYYFLNELVKIGLGKGERRSPTTSECDT